MDEKQVGAAEQRAEEAGRTLREGPADDANSDVVGTVRVSGNESASACPSNTLMQSSQVSEASPQIHDLTSSHHLPEAVFAIDWLECGAVAYWTDEAGRESFWKLSQMQDEAKASGNGNKPVPLDLTARVLLYDGS